MNERHGMTGTRIYKLWSNMRTRCNNPKASKYDRYGGRGIQVCNQWNSFENFRDWAVSSGYDENATFGKCTLDRIDPDGDYCPENCRFITNKEQQSNRTNNYKITIKGETKTVSEWAVEYGISQYTVFTRLRRGFDPELAVTTPVQVHNKHE